MTLTAKRNMRLEDALQAAEARYAGRNPESRRRQALAREVMPGGNTRSILHFSPFPLVMAGGEGASLTDVDGHRYIDFLGEYTAGLYGHSHPVILEAARRALDGGIVLGAPNRDEAELAALMCARFPSVEMVRFCNSGTEANLNALTAARAATGRDRILVFEHAYHGGMLSFAPGLGRTTAPFPFVMAPYNDAERTLALIEAHEHELAAVIVEPMMGAGGGIPGEPGFLEALRAATERTGALLIFDEVMTSRLSPGGRQATLGITPDMTTFGKYLGGGMSFGAFGGRRRIMERFDPARPDSIPHSGTYNNNVMTMAAGVAGLREVFTADEAVRLNRDGDRLRERLNALGERLDVPFQATGVGSILCLHLQREPVRRPEDTAHTTPDARALLHLELLDRGWYLARRGFVSLSLPLTPADHDGLLAALEEILSEYGDLLTA